MLSFCLITEAKSFKKLRTPVELIVENCEFRRRKTSPIQLIDTENCYIRLVFTAWSVDKRQLLRHQSAGKLVNSMCFIHGVSEDSYVPSIKTIFSHYYYDQWEVLSSSTTDKIHTSRKGASFTRWKTGDLKRVEHTNAFSYPLTMAISRVLKILFVKRTTKKTQHNKTKLSYLFGSLMTLPPKLVWDSDCWFKIIDSTYSKCKTMHTSLTTLPKGLFRANKNKLETNILS